MESFFVNQRENIFRNVEVLIYVFDIQSADLKKDLMYYRSTLDALSEHSPGASIFCLVHKMDLVADDCRALVRNVAILLTDDTFFSVLHCSYNLRSSQSARNSLLPHRDLPNAFASQRPFTTLRFIRPGQGSST